jgi:hypothetical protein
VHESVEVLEAPSEMPAGVRVHVKPVAGDIELVSAMVPVNPFSGVTVIVEVAVVPALTDPVVGLAATEKSVTVNVAVVEWDNDPFVPVIVRV